MGCASGLQTEPAPLKPGTILVDDLLGSRRFVEESLPALSTGDEFSHQAISVVRVVSSA